MNMPDGVAGAFLAPEISKINRDDCGIAGVLHAPGREFQSIGDGEHGSRNRLTPRFRPR